MSPQKHSQNSLESPLFPSYLLFSIDFKLLNTSSSDIIRLQLNVCSFVSLGKGMFLNAPPFCLFESEPYAKTKTDKKKMSAYLFQPDLQFHLG